ncbi:hypothetical protein [uncultured Ruminococcus sp.]|uniref:hypothetical protein n=1 Tax=uncultured Ruminococcus sp. TaxID=165186 RepID=UPI0025DABF95|nr:hypothetical protein [uncultured Ruminococcus sp.]
MVKMTCFRFNLDNPEHAKAWGYLHDFDRDKVKSGNTAVVKAVNEYFDRMQKLSDDPYFETRQREERFVQQIVSEVGKALIAEMPKLLASLMLSLNQGYAVQAPAKPVSQANNTAEDNENDEYSDIDLDFIGG